MRKLLRKTANRMKSDRQLAKLAGVTHYLVASVRQEMFPDPKKIGRTVRGGYTMSADGKSVRE